MSTVFHNIPPIYDESSRILILGSFPSVKSREGEFFYHHPKNRFWNVLAAVFSCDTPLSIESKKQFLAANHIALWDVVKSCELIGSDDSSIKNVKVNDIGMILDSCNIHRIFTNGGKAYELYDRFCLPALQREAIKLPSTSPANAAFSLERLIEKWKVICL